MRKVHIDYFILKTPPQYKKIILSISNASFGIYLIEEKSGIK